MQFVVLSAIFGEGEGEEVLGIDVALEGFHLKPDEGDEGGGNSEDLFALVDGEVAVIGGYLHAEGDDGSHAGLHRVVVLGPAFHLDQIAAFVGHVEAFVLVVGRKEVLDAVLELLREEQLEGTI